MEWKKKGYKINRRTERLPDIFVKTVPYLILREIGRPIYLPYKIKSKKKLMNYLHYPSRVAQNTKVTYSHCYGVINVFKDKGLVDVEKIGRRRCITITPRGREVLQLLTDTILPLKLTDHNPYNSYSANKKHDERR